MVMVMMPMVAAMRTVMIRPRMPWIGADIDGVPRMVLTSVMIAGSVVIAANPFAVAVSPGTTCKKEKSNGCQYDPFDMMCFHRVPPVWFASL
jgi:hypothetical protein